MFFSLMALVALQGDSPPGWLWYKDPPLKDTRVLSKKSVPPEEKGAKSLTAKEQLESLQKAYEDALHTAIITPTVENTLRAKRHHDALLARAERFQESWTLAELLDTTTSSLPTSPKALEVAREEEQRQLERALRALARSHGLIFVFKEGCRYCHEFAPVVQAFATQYGFDLQGLTFEGSCLKGMPCLNDKRVVTLLNPEGSFPALFLGNAKTKEVLPVARGLVNWRELHENFKTVLKMVGGAS